MQNNFQHMWINFYHEYVTHVDPALFKVSNNVYTMGQTQINKSNGERETVSQLLLI